ncbi:MAG: hydantoinase/oxoprolinase family protein [Planctomycetaceae bacterium]
MEKINRVHVIACGVLAVDLKDLVARLGFDVSLSFLPGGLHSTPRELRRRLQEAVDEATAQKRGDLIAIGYGVCGLGAVGIHARTIPLAIPRVNDCIALFLGSDSAYKEQFARFPGTYYISAGWVEEKATPQCSADKGADGNFKDAEFQDLLAKHGQENAHAIRYFLNSWQRNYQRGAFIDTGAQGRRRYADIAEAMSKEFGWKYEELAGSHDLLKRLLTQRYTSDEILIVPPHHVTTFDAVSRGLKAVPVWETDGGPSRNSTLVFDAPAAAGAGARAARLGLGIDAGGTYTDVAIYDFQSNAVLSKAKALTTKWDFTIGINKALDQLDHAMLADVDLVAISTTLATNAIVEGRGQKVGLLILPPYGLFDDADIAYRPIAVLTGKLEIDGREIAPIDPAQVRTIVREMIDKQQVTAFAVTGYASHVNPDHELQVKAIIQEMTALHVSCGHEVAKGVNYRLRAETAALNARIIPCLEAFIADVQKSLHKRGIDAPRMVVKSDGSLMTMQTAGEKPIETILSGPAASVAGARYLAGVKDAIVVDIGGTTTDTAVIRDGVVQTREDGATVGGWKTLVNALDMRTLGLGGDSRIAYEKQRTRIGPRRIAPVAWLAAHHDGVGRTLDYLQRRLDWFDTSSGGMDMLVLNGRDHRLALSDHEAAILDALHGGPLCLDELARRVDCVAWELLPLTRLEENHIVQRCGLTPTDLLHATGQVSLWDGAASRRMTELYGALAGLDFQQFAQDALDLFVRMLALELLKKQMDEHVDANALDHSPAGMALVHNLLAGGGEGYRVRVQLKRPIVGIGAPVHFFLPQAAALLETQAIIPPNADVANAIGAVTSSVFIQKRVEIVPNEFGRYQLEGLPGAATFANLEDAQQAAIDLLQHHVRELAARAGTSQRRVEILLHDQVAAVADGGQLFLGRKLEARLTGRPDLAALSS